MTLIMLCGQGSSGKSTTAKYLQEILKPAKVRIISMDDIVGRCYIESKAREYNEKFIYNIQQALNCNEYEYIIIDYALDHPDSRQWLLQQIFITFPLHFITISLRPGMQNIISWDQKRKKRALLEEEKITIQKLYNGFYAPQKEEFKNFAFLTINNYEIDNSIDVKEKLKQIFIL